MRTECVYSLELSACAAMSNAVASDDDFEQAEHRLNVHYEKLHAFREGFGRVHKARHVPSHLDLVIYCQQDEPGCLACTSMGGNHIGIFNLSLDVEPFSAACGQWLADSISETRSDLNGQLRLLDPSGQIFWSQLLGVKHVAIKEVPLDEKTVPSWAIRQASLLSEVRHKHVVDLIEAVLTPSKMILVFELMECDLREHMKAKKQILLPQEVQRLMNQLMTGMEFLHASRIIHRDIRPRTIFLDKEETLKIGNLMSAREILSQDHLYTLDVITTWYRPPELLLGSNVYSLPVDMWSCGCILAEMASGSPLFYGDSEIATLFLIFRKLGTPTEKQWKRVSELPHFKSTFPQFPGKPLCEVRNLCEQLGSAGIQVLEGLLCYDPGERMSATAAVQHEYLVETKDSKHIFTECDRAVIECVSGGAHSQDADHRIEAKDEEADAEPCAADFQAAIDVLLNLAAVLEDDSVMTACATSEAELGDDDRAAAESSPMAASR